MNNSAVNPEPTADGVPYKGVSIFNLKVLDHPHIHVHTFHTHIITLLPQANVYTRPMLLISPNHSNVCEYKVAPKSSETEFVND